MTYLTERNMPTYLSAMKKPEVQSKQIERFFDPDFDFKLNDAQKKEHGGLNVWTNEEKIAQNPKLRYLSKDYQGEKTLEGIRDTL